MATVGIPVLVWQDHHGGYTAATLEWESGGIPAAYDTSRTGAIGQLKRYFEWQAKTADFLPEPDFLDPILFQTRVTVRPEYTDPASNRRYPCEETIEIRVPCVRGTTAGGIVCCSLPTLGIGFYCHQPDALQAMIVERVHQELAGRTPQDLSQLLPPGNPQIDKVLVHVRSRRRAAAAEPCPLAVLPSIAQEMAVAGSRKSCSAAFRRDAEIAALADRLYHRTASLLLVGEDGVGKTTLLVSAVRSAQRMPEPKRAGSSGRCQPRFWHTAAARLIAGMRYLGQWQERCEQVIDELSRIGGVLCVENMIELVRTGGTDPSAGIAAFLLPYLQSGQLRLVTEATPAELDACRRLLPGFAQAFEVVRVEELTGLAAQETLDEIARAAARDARVDVEDGVSRTVLQLYRRFMPYYPLPGRAGMFLRQLADEARQQKRDRVESAHAVQRFVRQTGLAQRLLDDNCPLPLDHVFQALRQQVIGQDDACRAAARLVCTFKAGLNDPRRPIGSLLFCGPTGVGKTQLAKTLADYLFGHARQILPDRDQNLPQPGGTQANGGIRIGTQTDRLLRLDMSEYSAPWASQRLVTRSDGMPSDFIARMRRQPLAVVLLDEIEKAAPEVFDMLLGLLDEGRLTDRYGRTTWFRTAIVIMTSNLGASNAKAIGFGDEPSCVYERAVRLFFRPEFFNRIDSVVAFSPLNRTTCTQVVRKELNELAGREGVVQRGLTLRFEESLVAHLVAEGFDPQYGARPLQRTIEQKVVSRLARFLIENRTIRGGCLEIDCSQETNEIRVRHLPAG